jgi:hypothetical protein
MRANLASSGLLLFDVNELLVYRSFYAGTSVVERGTQRFTWRGRGSADLPVGSLCESRLEVETLDGDESTEEQARESVHLQRHFPESEVLLALELAGLDCLAVYGHGLDGIPRQPLDPSTHTKAIYIARRG